MCISCGSLDLYPQKLAITLPTSGGRSVSIVRSRTQTMEFFLFCFYFVWIDCLAKQLEPTGVCYEEQVVSFKLETFLNI
jgi:hypothetical protein